MVFVHLLFNNDLRWGLNFHCFYGHFRLQANFSLFLLFLLPGLAHMATILQDYDGALVTVCLERGPNKVITTLARVLILLLLSHSSSYIAPLHFHNVLSRLSFHLSLPDMLFKPSCSFESIGWGVHLRISLSLILTTISLLFFIAATIYASLRLLLLVLIRSLDSSLEPHGGICTTSSAIAISVVNLSTFLAINTDWQPRSFHTSCGRL